MQEYKIILTWEAIYDVTDIADYIEEELGEVQGDKNCKVVSSALIFVFEVGIF